MSDDKVKDIEGRELSPTSIDGNTSSTLKNADRAETYVGRSNISTDGEIVACSNDNPLLRKDNAELGN